MRVDIPVGLQLLLGTMQSPMLLLKKTAYEMSTCLVGSEMCIRDSALEDHEGTVNIGGRTITNLRFADDIDGEEAVSYTHLTLPTTHHV